MIKVTEKKEFEIESIETPKGSVPTIKGLEQVANHILDQFSPLEAVINTFANDITAIKRNLDNISKIIYDFGENFGQLVVLLGKTDKRISNMLEEIKEGKNNSIQEQQALLVELQTVLAKILIQFHQLPLELKVNPE